MKKLILVFMLYPFFAFSQSENDTAIFYGCVKRFYSLLFLQKVSISQVETIYQNSSGGYDTDLYIKEKCNNNKANCKEILKLREYHPDTATSYVMLLMKKHSRELTHGLSWKKMQKVIEKGRMVEIAEMFGISMDLIFPDGNRICFEFNRDEPTKIEYIWLNQGDEAYSMFSGEYNEKLLRIGKINDKDGFVNVREMANKNSKIVAKLYANDLFFYTPIGQSDWCPVSLEERGKYIGYVFKDKILSYEYFPKELRDKILKERYPGR
jgi:hypothetical protein